MPHPKIMRIKPAPGIKLRDPSTGDFLPEGESVVPRIPFWIRRVKDGDAIDLDKPETAAAEKKTAKGGK